MSELKSVVAARGRRREQRDCLFKEVTLIAGADGRRRRGPRNRNVKGPLQAGLWSSRVGTGLFEPVVDNLNLGAA